MQDTDHIRPRGIPDRGESKPAPRDTGGVPAPREIRKASELLKIVGDLTRMRILCALLEEELMVGKLQKVLGMSQSAVSHQLRILRDARLVTHRREWKLAYYSLADEHVRELLQFTLEYVRHD